MTSARTLPRCDPGFPLSFRTILKTEVLDANGRVRKPVRSITPSDSDLELMRLVAILQYLVGGLTLIVAAWILPDSDKSDHTAYYVLGGVALVLATGRYFQRSAMTLAHARLSNFAGLAYISVVVAVSTPIGATPAFYLWPVLTAAYFLRRRDLAVVLALFLIWFAIALWGFSADGSGAQVYGPMVLVLLVVTALVRLMRESLAAMIGDLEQTASTDDLTGLANRVAFRRLCGRDIERARRTGAPLSVAMIDLDHFKAINDRLGHAAGDEALQRFAGLLRLECRAADLPGRHGGEEFVVSLDDTGIEEAAQFAERLRARVETETATDRAPITISVGVAELQPGQTSPDDLIGAADTALYEAKAQGRNRVVRSSPTIEPAADVLPERAADAA